MEALQSESGSWVHRRDNRNQEPPAERGLDVNLSAPRKGERAGKPARHTFVNFTRDHTVSEGKYEPRT